MNMKVDGLLFILKIRIIKQFKIFNNNNINKGGIVNIDDLGIDYD